jgi:hypothetical protein
VSSACPVAAAVTDARSDAGYRSLPLPLPLLPTLPPSFGVADGLVGLLGDGDPTLDVTALGGGDPGGGDIRFDMTAGAHIDLGRCENGTSKLAFDDEISGLEPTGEAAPRAKPDETLDLDLSLEAAPDLEIGGTSDGALDGDIPTDGAGKALSLVGEASLTLVLVSFSVRHGSSSIHGHTGSIEDSRH